MRNGLTSHLLSQKNTSRCLEEGKKKVQDPSKQNLRSHTQERPMVLSFCSWQPGTFSRLLSYYSCVMLDICSLGSVQIIENRICLNSKTLEQSFARELSPPPNLTLKLRHTVTKPCWGPTCAQAAWGMGFPKVAKDQTLGLMGSECLKGEMSIFIQVFWLPNSNKGFLISPNLPYLY